MTHAKFAQLISFGIALTCVLLCGCEKSDRGPLSKPQYNPNPKHSIEIEIRHPSSAVTYEVHRLIATYSTEESASCCRHYFGIGTTCPSVEVPFEQQSTLIFTAKTDLVLPGECNWHMSSIRDPIWLAGRPHAILYLREEDLRRPSNRYKCYKSEALHDMQCINLERTEVKWDTTSYPIELEYIIRQK